MFKVNFDTKQFASIEAKFKKDIKDILAQPEVMSEVGEFMVERVKYQARVTKPFNADGSFPDLQPSTVRNRKYLARFNPTHDTYAPARANVTLTGRFLESLAYIVKGPGKVAIEYVGTHVGYKYGNGNVSKSVENKDLVKWLAKLGFRVMDRSISTNLVIKKRIKAIALRFVRRGLSVRNKLDGLRK